MILTLLRYGYDKGYTNLKNQPTSSMLHGCSILIWISGMKVLRDEENAKSKGDYIG